MQLSSLATSSAPSMYQLNLLVAIHRCRPLPLPLLLLMPTDSHAAASAAAITKLSNATTCLQSVDYLLLSKSGQQGRSAGSEGVGARVVGLTQHCAMLRELLLLQLDLTQAPTTAIDDAAPMLSPRVPMLSPNAFGSTHSEGIHPVSVILPFVAEPKVKLQFACDWCSAILTVKLLFPNHNDLTAWID